MPELQVESPGRALSPSLPCPGEPAGGREALRGGGHTETSCWLIFTSFPLYLFGPTASSFFTTVCYISTLVCTITLISIWPHLCCPSVWQANKDPLFLTGVTFPSEYPVSPETLVRLTVYDVKDKSQESVSKHLLFYILCGNLHIESKREVMIRMCSKPTVKQASFKC